MASVSLSVEGGTEPTLESLCGTGAEGLIHCTLTQGSRQKRTRLQSLLKQRQAQGPHQAGVTDKTLRENGHLSLKHLINKPSLLWKHRYRLCGRKL